MKSATWFDQYVSESLLTSLIDGFTATDRVAAAEIISKILAVVAKTILLEETDEKYQSQVFTLLASEDLEAISDWLASQPIVIIDALRERLDRTLLQIQAQLAAKPSSAILHEV